jgi:hypothetical protein
MFWNRPRVDKELIEAIKRFNVVITRLEEVLNEVEKRSSRVERMAYKNREKLEANIVNDDHNGFNIADFKLPGVTFPNLPSYEQIKEEMKRGE